MTEYIAQCRHHERDRVIARVDGPSVELEMRIADTYEGEAYLSPADARTFARGILALADEIDGEEAKEKAPANSRPKVGDRVRVVRNAFEYEGAPNVGSVGTLKRIDSGDQSYMVDVEGYGDWWCAEVELVDEPTTSTPASSAFAAHVEEAKRLLAGTDHTGADVITLARDLADRA